MKPSILILLAFLNFFTVLAQHNKLEVVVDERMELLTTVQYLSDYFLITKANIGYKSDIDIYFEDYKNHEVIELMSKVQKEFFSFSNVPMVVYKYSFPEFVQQYEFAQAELERMDYEKNKETIAELMLLLKDFYEVSNFHEFYIQHQGMYEEIISDIEGAISSYDIPNLFEEHYGMSKRSYTLVLTPLLHDGGFATQTRDEQGIDLLAIIGPLGTSVGSPKFNLSNILQTYILHEFSHSFCNPLIDEFYDQLEADSCLLEPIRESLKKQAYGSWKTCLYEHLVRANEIILTEQTLGKEEADKVYKDNYENRDWKYLKGLVPLLRTYKNNKSEYKKLQDFMPEIIEYFHSERESCD